MDLGAVLENGDEFHSASLKEFHGFISDAEFVCGHNIIHHDLKYILPALPADYNAKYIDTLYLSPLLFPERPYHKLLKDDKLLSDELNNPLNDSKKAQKLFHDEVNVFLELDERVKEIYFFLLNSVEEFSGFFDYLEYKSDTENIAELIREVYRGKICENAELESFVAQKPMELAYSLALIGTEDYHSVTPAWLTYNSPAIENIIKLLCNTPCKQGCEYCSSTLDIHKKLKEFFGYNEFREYNGEPLQEMAAQAAVDGKSLLAVFPTGGGKSITFQLPALMAGQTEHGLTVVISPLQSLMKDQVDNLDEKGLVDAVTVNGLLSPVERSEALERVSNGLATIIYISPEQLRSRTIEKLLLSRNVVRFVIDEAHCFSAWGQDFRVDYLYIGEFIRSYQEKKSMTRPIPVSCFTATAKQKVISDIRDYFKENLGLDLELFASSAERKNLRYNVLYKETEDEKYNTLRSLIEQKNCPTIVYASRTKRTRELAEKLTQDGFRALPYNGKMESSEKIENQEAFMNNEVKIIVATSAFGMGVDKRDVGLVVHYDISDSLENYVQEAGRAGRDPSMQADCYVLFNNSDLDKHFILLNQTKVSIGEIQRVWTAMKNMTKNRPTVCCSALELAREAGWQYEENKNEMETRVKTCIAALENAGYVKRGHNVPRVYANSILAKNMEEASNKIRSSTLFSDKQKTYSIRIVKSLISSRSHAKADNGDAESRVDYLADTLGIEKRDVIDCVNLMRQIGLLADMTDMSAYIFKNDRENTAVNKLEQFAKLERFILNKLEDGENDYNLKQLNEAAQGNGIKFSTVRRINTILYFLTIREYITKENHGENNLTISLKDSPSRLKKRCDKRYELSKFIVNYLYEKAYSIENNDTFKNKSLVQFSLVELYTEYLAEPKMDASLNEISLTDVEEALLYLSKIECMTLEGGFLVLYNGLELKRLILDNKIRYKKEDYQTLSEYYKQKIQQIHIVGEYANLMVRDYDSALQFVQDYFQLDFKKFIAKYFKGERAIEIERNITPEKYHQLVGELSDAQKAIINDDQSKYIVVAAGPGSGKTRVLVHKLASLLLLEDVKHEQLLMLTFSRAAATEFKKRLMSIIGNAANFVEIKTFHSYCFDLLGKIGSLESADNVVKDAAGMIENGEVEPGRIAKSVIVVDEAQDMDKDEYALIRALMRYNETVRVIAVGDDDQNIYEFRGSSPRYMRSLITELGAVQYELIDNYRSRGNVVALANEFATTISERMKTVPIKAVNAENGTVKIIRHASQNLEEPVVQNIIESYQDGKSCVLTTTNDEALRVTGLLNKRGIHAKLIQSLDGFRLYNLAEIRFFLKKIDSRLQTSVISDEIWEYAKNELKRAYSDSSCLETCLNMISDFESTNSYSKYRSDLEEFIKESQYEDFYSDEFETVYVSTIHKSKGREFDNVYMLLNNVRVNDDAESRKIYVGMTRAKNNLYIHCSSGIFEKYNIPGVENIEDQKAYPEPDEIALQLTHRDVVLSFFKGKKAQTFKLHSGKELAVDGVYLTAELDGKTVRVAKLSKACAELFENLNTKGYSPSGAEVRFVVAWKDPGAASALEAASAKDGNVETPVLLANVFFKKN